LVLGAVLLSGASARAQPVEAATVVIVAADATTSEWVAGRVQDLLADLLSGAQIEFAERFSPGDLFLADEPERPRAKAWVSIVGPVAQVRVANAKRERFVFRDLVVSQPLTEIDRERIGQTLKAALLTVAEEGAPTLDRGKAEAALRIPPRPSPPSPPAGPSRQLPDGEAPRPPAPITPVIVPAPVLPPRLRVAVAELYEVEWASASVSGLNGPGLLGRLELEWPRFSIDRDRQLRVPPGRAGIDPRRRVLAVGMGALGLVHRRAGLADLGGTQRLRLRLLVSVRFRAGGRATLTAGRRRSRWRAARPAQDRMQGAKDEGAGAEARAQATRRP
jgi:hypothetical protein